MTSQIRYLLDPALWVREVLGHQLWEKQIEILESIRDHKITVVKSCHSAGKSFIASSAVLWYLYTHPRSLILSTAPTQRQVEGILWREIRTSHQRAKIPLAGELLMQELRLADDWKAFGFTSDEPVRFQGFHSASGYMLVVADESCGIEDQIFDSLDSILTSDESRLLLISNPTNPSGRFFKEFTSEGSNKISISAFDCPNFTKFGITEQDIINDTWREKVTGALPMPFLVTPGWVSERLARWGKDSPLYLSKVLAEFPSAGADTLIPLHWIERAIGRIILTGKPIEIGCDPARFGSDESVIMFRQGGRARILKVLPMCDTMTLTGEIILAMRETGATLAKIDAVGVGAGVFDRLKEQKVPVMEMQSASSPRDKERFANARAEWWWNLRTLFETGDIDIENDEILVSQLANIRYKVNSSGKILIESKEEAKRHGQKSPDRADALMLVMSTGTNPNTQWKFKDVARFTLGKPINFSGEDLDEIDVRTGLPTARLCRNNLTGDEWDADTLKWLPGNRGGTVP